MPESLNIDVAELLAIIGERTVITRKQEQRINELEGKIKELEETIRKNGKLD